MIQERDKNLMLLLQTECELLDAAVMTLVLSVEKCKAIGRKAVYTFEEQESFVDEDVNQDPPEVTADPPPVSKRGRASIPSWDEIVFGTKTED
jgi:hypothetical protein